MEIPENIKKQLTKRILLCDFCQYKFDCVNAFMGYAVNSGCSRFCKMENCPYCKKHLD